MKSKKSAFNLADIDFEGKYLYVVACTKNAEVKPTRHMTDSEAMKKWAFLTNKGYEDVRIFDKELNDITDSI